MGREGMGGWGGGVVDTKQRFLCTCLHLVDDSTFGCMIVSLFPLACLCENCETTEKRKEKKGGRGAERKFPNATDWPSEWSSAGSWWSCSAGWWRGRSGSRTSCGRWPSWQEGPATWPPWRWPPWSGRSRPACAPCRSSARSRWCLSGPGGWTGWGNAPGRRWPPAGPPRPVRTSAGTATCSRAAPRPPEVEGEVSEPSKHRSASQLCASVCWSMVPKAPKMWKGEGGGGGGEREKERESRRRSRGETRR